MKRTRFWVGVLAAAALLSVGAILLLGRWSGGGHMARIYQDGVLIREIDLDSLSAPLTFTVEFQGRTNTITAQPGRIRVESKVPVLPDVIRLLHKVPSCSHLLQNESALFLHLLRRICILHL